MVLLWIALSVNSKQLRNIGTAKCIVSPTNPTVGRATALPAHYVSAPLCGPSCKFKKLVYPSLPAGRPIFFVIFRHVKC